MLLSMHAHRRARHLNYHSPFISHGSADHGSLAWSYVKRKTLFSEYRVSNRRDGGTDISENKCIGLHGVLQ